MLAGPNRYVDVVGEPGELPCPSHHCPNVWLIFSAPHNQDVPTVPTTVYTAGQRAELVLAIGFKVPADACIWHA